MDLHKGDLIITSLTKMQCGVVPTFQCCIWIVSTYEGNLKQLLRFYFESCVNFDRWSFYYRRLFDLSRNLKKSRVHLMNIEGHFTSRIMQILYSQAIVLLCNTHIKP